MLYEWFSVTRTIGLMAYTASLVACLVRWVWGRRRDEPGYIFAMLAALQLALLLDKIFNWRWKLHEHWMRAAMVDGIYDQRRPLQLLGLGLLGILLATVMVWTWRHLRRRPGLAMALTGTLLSIGLWCCEAVSYHNFDRVLFFKVGHAMVVSFLWAGLGLFTTFGAWRDGWSYRVG